VTISRDITRLEHSSVKLTLTISQADVRSEYDSILSGYANTIQIAGFRKGKIPRPILERKLGDALRDEVRMRVLDKALQEVFVDETFPKDATPLPYGEQVTDSVPTLDPDKELQFSVVYDVFPRITIGAWQGLDVEYPDIHITDEDVERELQSLRERNAIVQDKDDAEPAVIGDVVTVNYSDRGDDGQVVPGTEREDFVFTLGTYYNLFRFDDEIVGMRKGETRDFDKTYPPDIPNKELAGAVKRLRVTLTALKKRELPALDDDLAQDVDEKFHTLDELRAHIRGILEKDLEGRLRDVKASRVIEKIMETSPVDIPRSMINMEITVRWRRIARYFKPDQAPDRGVPAAVAENWRPETVQLIHSRLVMQRLMEDQGIDVPDAELEEEMARQAAELGASVEDIRGYFAEPERRKALAEEIRERKLIDLILERNTLRPGAPAAYVDLISRNG